MSRFSGWKMSDLRGLNVLDEDLPEISEKRRETCRETRKTGKISTSPDYVGMISSALNILEVDHVREYKFLEDRRFKFDIAIPERKIAIEFEGGIFSGGRHTRGKGYSNDAKKYNLATRHQWKLLRYTSEDAKTINWEFKIANEILDFLKNEEQNES